RLDLEADRRSLAQTVLELKPRLLILDPFVRLHRIDENASGEVAPLLAYLRELQRRYGCALYSAQSTALLRNRQPEPSGKARRAEGARGGGHGELARAVAVNDGALAPPKARH